MMMSLGERKGSNDLAVRARGRYSDRAPASVNGALRSGFCGLQAVARGWDARFADRRFDHDGLG
jgi:hypothetical protein